jgi:hypothetical protein
MNAAASSSVIALITSNAELALGTLRAERDRLAVVEVGATALRPSVADRVALGADELRHIESG